MGKVDFFVVEFYGGKRIFYLGEVLNGIFCLKVNKELKLWGIWLEFYGKVLIYWFELIGLGENRRIRYYRNSEIYIDILVILFGKGKWLYIKVKLLYCFKNIRNMVIDICKYVDCKEFEILWILLIINKVMDILRLLSWNWFL